MRYSASSLLALAAVVAVDAALTSFDVRAMHRLARDSIQSQLSVKERRDANKPVTSSSSDSGQFLAMYSFADEGCSEDGAWTAFSVDTGACVTFDIKGHNVAYQLVCASNKFSVDYWEDSKSCKGSADGRVDILDETDGMGVCLGNSTTGWRTMVCTSSMDYGFATSPAIGLYYGDNCDERRVGIEYVKQTTCSVLSFGSYSAGCSNDLAVYVYETSDCTGAAEVYSMGTNKCKDDTNFPMPFGDDDDDNSDHDDGSDDASGDDDYYFSSVKATDIAVANGTDDYYYYGGNATDDYYYYYGNSTDDYYYYYGNSTDDYYYYYGNSTDDYYYGYDDAYYGYDDAYSAYDDTYYGDDYAYYGDDDGYYTDDYAYYGDDDGYYTDDYAYYGDDDGYYADDDNFIFTTASYYAVCDASKLPSSAFRQLWSIWSAGLVVVVGFLLARN